MSIGEYISNNRLLAKEKVNMSTTYYSQPYSFRKK